MAKQTQSILKQTLVDEAVKLLAWTKNHKVFPKNGDPLLMSAAVNEAEIRIRPLIDIAIEINKPRKSIEAGLRQLVKSIGREWSDIYKSLTTPSKAAPPVAITVALLTQENKSFQAFVGGLCQIVGVQCESIDDTPAHDSWQHAAFELVKLLRQLELLKFTVSQLNDPDSEVFKLCNKIERKRIDLYKLSPPGSKRYIWLDCETCSLKTHLRTGEVEFSPTNLANMWEGFVQGHWPNLTCKRIWDDNNPDYEFVSKLLTHAKTMLNKPKMNTNYIRRLLKPSGTIRYMQKPQRLKVHRDDLRSHLEKETIALKAQGFDRLIKAVSANVDPSKKARIMAEAGVDNTST